MLNTNNLLLPTEGGTICQGTFVVAHLASTGFLTNVQVGRHEFWADGCASEGGQNLGPAPYDLLLAALATCSAIALRQCAHRRGWTLHQVKVHLVHHVLAETESASGKLTERIEQRLELTGNLSEKQRRHLQQVAATCPVARALEPGIPIDTILQ